MTVGLLVAIGAWRWAADPAPRIERAKEEAAVVAAREHLGQLLPIGEPQLVDPLAPDLMKLDAANAMTHLRVQDAELLDLGKANPVLEVLPGATR